MWGGDRLNGEKLNRMGLCGLAKEGFTNQVRLRRIWETEGVGLVTV